jgi:hypothetical protein
MLELSFYSRQMWKPETHLGFARHLFLWMAFYGDLFRVGLIICFISSCKPQFSLSCNLLEQLWNSPLFILFLSQMLQSINSSWSSWVVVSLSHLSNGAMFFYNWEQIQELCSSSLELDIMLLFRKNIVCNVWVDQLGRQHYCHWRAWLQFLDGSRTWFIKWQFWFRYTGGLDYYIFGWQSHLIYQVTVMIQIHWNRRSQQVLFVVWRTVTFVKYYGIIVCPKYYIIKVFFCS